MHFHLKVNFRFDNLKKNLISFFIAFKRCVTTFLSRERECDENNNGQGNWSIVDLGVNLFLTISYQLSCVIF
jgi:hypothetical protein